MHGLVRGWILGLALIVASVASAALVDDGKLAAAKRAGDEFARRAQGSATTGVVPRAADPGIAPLLDAVFNNAAIPKGEALPISESGKLGELLASGNRVGLAYILAGAGTGDLATQDPKALERADQNVVTYAPEIGRWFDFQIGIQDAFAASTLAFLAAAAPATLERPNVKSGLANVRQGLARSLGGVFQTMATGGLDDAWRRDRLVALAAVVDKAAELVTPEDAVALRTIATELSGQVRSADVQDRLKDFARRIAPGKP
jgi:hypothetical protein